MNANIKKTTIKLDGSHLLDVSVNDEKMTVVAELSACGEDPVLIYAEKFDAPCNYLRTAIKKAITYIGAGNEPHICGENRSDDGILNKHISGVIM